MKASRRAEIVAGAPLSALLLTNMWPTEANPKFGSFVRDAERSMSDAGVRTRVVAITDPRAGKSRNVRKYAGFYTRAMAAAARGGFDAVHAHYLYPTGAAGLRAARLRDVPLIAYSHGSDVLLAQWGWPTGPGTLRVAGEADALVVPSRAHAAVVRESLGVPEDRIAVIPVGVDLAFYTPGDAGWERQSLGLDPGSVTLLFAGALDENKGAGLADLVRAMADPALERTAGGPVELQVVGEGPRRDELETLAEELGVAERIAWRGWADRSELRSLMRAADVVVVPSKRESLGLVALEAAAVGTPVVSTRAGGLPEHVLPGITGELYDAGDAAGLVGALCTTIDEIHAGTLHPGVDPYRFGLGSTGERLEALTRRLIAGGPVAEPEPEPASQPDEADSGVFDAAEAGIQPAGPATAGPAPEPEGPAAQLGDWGDLADPDAADVPRTASADDPGGEAS